jgi:rhodanese-related sulfurtransferase
MTGVQPKAAYVRAITMLAGLDVEKPADMPDGVIEDGVRVIRLTTATSPGDLYVYRGETVTIIVEKVDFPYSIHVPEYNISQQAVVGQDLAVTFKAKSTGVFPVFCNGDCPSGNGERFGRIIVMQYAAGDKFRELTVAEAKELIAKSRPLILDVRTPGEFYGGHLPGARLIPLQQLSARCKEIERFKDTDILIYCRSGNRSTVASEILVEKGFSRLHNLRHGVIGWEKAGEKLEKNGRSGAPGQK